MARAYSMDLRERVIAAMAAGLSTHAAAKRFAIGRATAGAWPRRWRASGSAAPGRQGQPQGSKLDAHAGFILGLVEANKDLTLSEIAQRLKTERGVVACPATVWQFFAKRGISYKKRRPMRLSSSARM